MSANRAVSTAPTRQALRPSVEKLTAQQLVKLQEAIGALAAISDDRGYQHFASLHGGPPKSYCQHGYADQWNRYHGAPLFLPWHRAYLHFVELAMADRVAGVTLAWWDWSSSQSRAEGIPAGYEGTDNPLAGQPIAKGAERPKGIPASTWREPDKPENLPDGATVQGILELTSFMDFSTQLEQQLHNAVHGWVGGAMGSVPIAAYDPIFFAHHCMVDRLWRLWQLKHGQPGPPAGSSGVVLDPFPLTVGDVLNVGALGYDYAGTTTSAPGA